MPKQYLDKDGLQTVVNNVKEAKEIATGAVGLAQSVSEKVDNLPTGYVDTLTMVGEPFDTSYQDGSSSRNYIVTDGLYKFHIFLSNPDNSKSSNQCEIRRYIDGVEKAVLFDENYTGAGVMQQEKYVRVKSGTLNVTHSASGGSVQGRCYFVLYKVNESN
jgi:hypothetical protein